MSAATFKAAIPQPFRILGLPLKPLSIGRYRLLARFNCAFVSDEDRNATVEDLILGVLICSMTVQGFLSWIETDWKNDIAEWGAKVGVFDLEDKAKLFLQYISESSDTPKFWSESNGEPSSAHWSQCLEVSLRSETGWTKEEIDEEPLSKAISDFLKLSESKGRIKLLNQKELDAVEWLEKNTGGNN